MAHLDNGLSHKISVSLKDVVARYLQDVLVQHFHRHKYRGPVPSLILEKPTLTTASAVLWEKLGVIIAERAYSREHSELAHYDLKIDRCVYALTVRNEGYKIIFRRSSLPKHALRVSGQST